jgi:hypothetical protein
VTWGEHRLFQQHKSCAYEECQRVPFIVSFPKEVTASRRSQLPVLNIDIAPTFADIAGVPVPGAIDGRSFAPILRGQDVRWRTDYLLESWWMPRGAVLRHNGQGARSGDRLRLFHGDPTARPRASVAFEFQRDGRKVSAGAVWIPISGPVLGRLSGAVRRALPDVPIWPLRDGTRGLRVVSYLEQNAYWWEEVDAGDAFEVDYPMPDFVGVRDVENGFTWVEYETGETELYDLGADPSQLSNVADAAAYAETRARLEARLVVLLADVVRSQ